MFKNLLGDFSNFVKLSSDFVKFLKIFFQLERRFDLYVRTDSKSCSNGILSDTFPSSFLKHARKSPNNCFKKKVFDV